MCQKVPARNMKRMIISCLMISMYYKNGQKKEEVTYKYGKEYGLWTDWWSDGVKRTEKTYKNGKVIFEKEWIKMDRGTVK